MAAEMSKISKKLLCAALLAHVDAGKTTLSEAMLYNSGSIRKMGRVDNKDAFLDNDALERSRGITIFSKQAVFNMGEMQVTLLDTPGHVDFSAEMERTLQVLDYAVLVINGADGVQGHTETLWGLLKRYKIPVFLFINKMDQEGTDPQRLLAELKERLSEECIDFSLEGTPKFYESVAMTDEKVLNDFLEKGKAEEEDIRSLIMDRKIFPCFFGSALKNIGVRELLTGLERYTEMPDYPEEFGAKVFKIARDDQGNRLTFLKVTGGLLKTRTALIGCKNGESWQEKVNQIRIYSGEKFSVAEEAPAGCVCAVTGLGKTYPGEGLGTEKGSGMPALEPVLTYRICFQEDCDAAFLLPKLRLLEEEEPQLHIMWNETLGEIQAKIMGEVQTEVLKSLLWERFGIRADFDRGNIVYKETIANVVEGVGHFEPLRHYAEVHLLLEPGERGSGLVFAADCSEDLLDKNWQRLVLSHLAEKEFKGVLTGAPVTDMKITLVAGKAHSKHTEGGDFRQATYRALRQGLMEAESVLLEPYYEFRLEVPEAMVGRAMTDIEKMNGTFSLPERFKDMAVLSGSAPVATMQNYQTEVAAYTKGRGKLSCRLKGYEPCHNTEEVIEKTGYVPEQDLENTADSVFCAHGAGFIVKWNEVRQYMHVEGCLTEAETEIAEKGKNGSRRQAEERKDPDRWLGTEEIDAILDKTLYANRRDKKQPRKGITGKKGSSSVQTKTADAVIRTWKKAEKKESYLLVDGYNVIFAWEDLKELAAVNIDSARGKLMDVLCNYQAIKACELIVVFDAYRLQGHKTETLDYHNIHVVYTKEAETADQYIEKFAHENGRSADVMVATSDGLEQIIIRGQGCRLISARELKAEIESAGEQICREYAEKQPIQKNYLSDVLKDKEHQTEEKS